MADSGPKKLAYARASEPPANGQRGECGARTMRGMSYRKVKDGIVWEGAFPVTCTRPKDHTNDPKSFHVAHTSIVPNCAFPVAVARWNDADPSKDVY